MKALIVDDEKEICMLLSYQLNKFGITTTEAHSIADGLSAFDPNVHEIVFLDINLPDGNGLDIIPELKLKNEEVKVVVISAYDTKTEHRKAYEMGIYEFLGKPFTKQMIVEIVTNISNPN